MSFIDFINEMAANADWHAVHVVSETMVALPFGTDEGTVNVFIRPCGRVQGKTVLEFSSAGVPVPTDGEVKSAMMELLMLRNATLTMGHLAIETAASEAPKFTIMATQIAETMDAVEFRAAVGAIRAEHENLVGSLRRITRRSRVDF